MDCSSGLSRFPNGRPYWMPTDRRAAAPARIAASAVPRPPHWLPAQRSAARVRLDLRRTFTDELGDVCRADDHRIDSGPLELLDLLATRDRDVRDRELARRDIRQELERVAESVFVVVPGSEQEDLRIEALERELELLFVADRHDAVEPQVGRLCLLTCQPVIVVAGIPDRDQPGVGSRQRGLARRPRRPPQDRELGDGPQVLDEPPNCERLGALGSRPASSVRIRHVDDHGDAVALRDGLAEPALAPHVKSIYWPTGCQTVLSSRK